MHNGQKFPHCGIACRDNAKAASKDPFSYQIYNTILRPTIDLAGANLATCETCIICWKTDSRDNGEFCSEECAEVADKKAPFLLELPRGHVAFKKGTVSSFSKDPYSEIFH